MIMVAPSRVPLYWADDELRQLESLPGPVREFLADACEECPQFLGEYLIPTLGKTNSNEIILRDLADAISDLEISKLGLGDFGNLGKSFFKRIKKAVSRVARKVEQVFGRKRKKSSSGRSSAPAAPATSTPAPGAIPPTAPSPINAPSGGGGSSSIAVAPSGGDGSSSGSSDVVPDLQSVASGIASAVGAQPTAQPAPAADGMSSMLIPAVVIAAAVIFSGGGGGSRRTRRNPSRRRRSGLGRGWRLRSRRIW